MIYDASAGNSAGDLAAFIDLLVEVAPSWLELWSRCQQDYRGLAPWIALRTVARDLSEGDLDCRSVLDFLEYQIGQDAAVDELMLGAFLTKITELHLSPGLRAALDLRVRGEGIRAGWAHTAFVTDLAVKNSPAGMVLREHLADWNELMTHGFMDDLVRAATVWLDTAEGRSSVVSMLAALHDAYGHDDEIDELIATGFVENLPYPQDAGAQLLRMLGPRLRTEYNLERPAHQIGDLRA